MLHPEQMTRGEFYKNYLLSNFIRDETEGEPSGSSTLAAQDGIQNIMDKFDFQQ